MSEIVPFELPTPPRENRSGLRDFLACHLAYERMKKTREALLHVLVACAVVPWVTLVWPRAVSVTLEEYALACWLVLLAGTVLAGALEWMWRHKREDCLSRMNHHRALDDGIDR